MGPLDEVEWSAFDGAVEEGAVEIHDDEDAARVVQEEWLCGGLGEV